MCSSPFRGGLDFSDEELRSALLRRGRGRVVATGREPLKSEALAALQAEFPGRCIPVPCDVTDAASIRAMADVVRSACGGAGLNGGQERFQSRAREP